MERFNLIVVRPDDDVHYQAYADTASALHMGLRRLGYAARLAENEMIYDATNVVFGAHNLDAAVAATLPLNTIIYNTEIVVVDSPFVSALEPFVRRFETWDYSSANVVAWRDAGICDRVRWLQPGYLPEYTTIDPATPTDIAALFYGHVNPRRRAILGRIADCGVAVHVVSDVYGEARSALIARAKLVLNIHSGEHAVLEFARVSHALSNRRALITEANQPDEVDADLRDAIAAAPAGQLGELCASLLADDARRSALAMRGFESLRRRDFAASIRDVLAARAEQGATRS